MDKEIKELKTLHYALCFGALMIMLLLHSFMQPIDFSSLDTKIGSMGFLALCVASINLIIGNLIFKKKITTIGSKHLTSENIQEFRAAYILKWAFLEGAILMNILFYFFMDESPILIVVALLLLLLLFVSKPKYNT